MEIVRGSFVCFDYLTDKTAAESARRKRTMAPDSSPLNFIHSVMSYWSGRGSADLQVNASTPRMSIVVILMFSPNGRNWGDIHPGYLRVRVRVSAARSARGEYKSCTSAE